MCVKKPLARVHNKERLFCWLLKVPCVEVSKLYCIFLIIWFLHWYRVEIENLSVLSYLVLLFQILLFQFPYRVGLHWTENRANMFPNQLATSQLYLEIL